MEGLSRYEKDVRPWGGFERFTLNEPSTVKIITVLDGEEFSLQTHEHRAEFWKIVSGTGEVRAGEEVSKAMPGDAFFIPKGTKHRAKGGTGGLMFLEIAL